MRGFEIIMFFAPTILEKLYQKFVFQPCTHQIHHSAAFHTILDEGIKQCCAQLVGAKKYNEKKGIITEKLYGCTTTGDVWQFIEYSDKLYIDDKKYYLGEISELLGVFQSIIDYYKSVLK